jgi:hypothetical protein
MVTNSQIEERLFDYFNDVFGAERALFGFSDDENEAYIVDRQTDSPRPAASTVLFYRVESVAPIGGMITSDEVLIDRTGSRTEYIERQRKVHVITNILSKYKGLAKDAINFFIAASQTSRGYNSSYTGTFEFPLHNIANDLRDLTNLENDAWTERVEADLYFNFKDRIDLDVQNMIVAPSSVELTRTKVNYDIELK